MHNPKRMYTSGLIAALLATSSLSAKGITDKLVAIGLTPHDVRFSKNESDHLEVTVTSTQAMETLSKMEGLPNLDARETDARFMKPQADQTWTGTAMYRDVIANLPAGRQPSYERWQRIVEGLVTDTLQQRPKPDTSAKKAKTGTGSKVAETA